MDILGSLVRRSRKLDKRTTNDNKRDIINEFNRHAKEYGFNRLSKDSSVADVNKAKKEYQQKLDYDITNLSIQEGNTVLASTYGKSISKSPLKDVKRLGKFAEDLANAKRQSDKKLNESEKAFLERGNQNIKGYGNEDIITLFENTKNDKQAKQLIDEIKNQNPKQIFYDKQADLFEKVFQKIELTREEDIDKIKEKLKEMNFMDMKNQSNKLLQSLEIYGSEQQVVGKGGNDETELANARLDDTLIQLGLNKNAQNKVSVVKKTLSKYKTQK